MHHSHHRGQQRNHLPVSEAVHGSAERKRSLIFIHFPRKISQSFAVTLQLLIISKPAALYQWAQKIIIVGIYIHIGPLLKQPQRWRMKGKMGTYFSRSIRATGQD